MLVPVISTPHPMRPGDIREWRLRVGRGAAVVFDLADNEALHARLTEWLTFIPAHLEIYPLVSREAHQRGIGGAADAPASST